MRILAVFLLIGALLGIGCEAPAGAPAVPGSMEIAKPSPPAQSGSAWPADVLPLPAGFPDQGIAAEDARRQRLRDVWVVGTGTVERLLRDDTKRPRHQRFIVRLRPLSESTALFAHNIDLAPRVPFKRGDTLAFRGKYVWNEQGGVVHWTHRDRRDRKSGGWIIWKGQNFR